MNHSPTVCVLIPCYNEVESIAAVVREYQTALPLAHLLVVDNASTDGTAKAAEAAGAEVLLERRRGKARAVLGALPHVVSRVDPDVLIMVDGDGSYPAEGALRLLQAYRAHGLDMVTGVRRPELTLANNGATPIFRPMHQAGTALFGRTLGTVFGFHSRDLFSGLRLFSRRCYQHMPILSRGFELELELTVQAIDKGFRMDELDVPFRKRTAGTSSKLRTVHDGLRILRFLLVLFRDYRPLACFGGAAAALGLASLLAGSLPVLEFLHTGFVGRLPLAVLAASLMIVAWLTLQTGLILESGLRYNREACQTCIRRSCPLGTTPIGEAGLSPSRCDLPGRGITPGGVPSTCLAPTSASYESQA